MKQKSFQFRRSAMARSVLIACGATATVLAMQPALAQDATLQRVEITGSAIKRIDAETSVPVSVVKIDDLKKQGVTTVEGIMNMLSASQATTGTSQMVGSGSAGASFANLRGIGANKTLVLLNGRRIANNAFDSSAPDLNMIPLAAIDKVEVLRDGASSLYGTDAIGGVINFITKKNYTGGTATIGGEIPMHPGGRQTNANVGFGFGDLDTNGYNVFGFVDYQKADPIGGADRPINARYPGGLSPTPSPANYFQGGDSGNPAAPSCASGTFTIPDAAGKGCQMATSNFVNYTPTTERLSAMLKGTVKINPDTQLSLEYFGSKDQVRSQIAPVPYGGLYMNRTMPNGALNPYYPGNTATSITPNIALDPTYTESPAKKNADGTLSAGKVANLLPGFIHVKWRDLPNGPRTDIADNTQNRLLATLDGVVGNWDYQVGASFNENKVADSLAGYSDGGMITAGMLNGVLNPFGAQSDAGNALLAAAATNGTLQTARGQVTTGDAHASRELSDMFGAGRKAAIALGMEVRHEDFHQQAEFDYASKVVSSTGIDPNTLNEGKRDVYAAYTEFNLPVTKALDITLAARYDHYSDFGSTVNPKLSFRFQPSDALLMRGSVSTGFRAPSLYDLYAAQAYTNGTKQNDPVNCPGGTVVAGKSAAANCGQQFTVLQGGNTGLMPEKSKSVNFGIVLQPVKDMSLAIDLWQINLEQQIGGLSTDTIFQNYQTFKGNFHRTSTGDLSTDGSQCPDPVTCGYVDTRTQNLGGLNTNGVDITGTYRLRTDSGVFTFGLNSTFVNKYEYQDYTNGPWNQNVGAFVGTGPIFKWQHNLAVNWSKGEFGAGLAAHYKSGYLDSPSDAPDGFSVDSYMTYDVYGSWAPAKGVSIVAGIKNLTDAEPPLSYQTYVFQAGYDPRFADPTGRSYYVRASYSW